ncbi:hypothetical protein SBA6_130002 [Candidatus Sulfopaludibacter sp. SbA6]|nr:hypothetical protein SBA6_130002 [Candidatus Sulfopaludibacter sp. SbA6]
MLPAEQGATTSHSGGTNAQKEHDVCGPGGGLAVRFEAGRGYRHRQPRCEPRRKKNPELPARPARPLRPEGYLRPTVRSRRKRRPPV